MKSKKAQLIVLGTLLAAVIAVGAWLVLRTPGESAPETPPASSGDVQMPTESQPLDISDIKPSAYRPVRQVEEDSLPRRAPVDPMTKIFFFENQLCVFSYRQRESEEDLSVDVVSMASGEVLRTYGPEESYKGCNFNTLAFDRNGTLWCAYYDGEWVTLAPLPERRYGKRCVLLLIRCGASNHGGSGRLLCTLLLQYGDSVGGHIRWDGRGGIYLGKCYILLLW
ncbi:MAG: hypothetical protein K2P08_06975 [Oscillospiraceae bacterium]|nr:hypothetical protein [Oscillospiraceae bacterium]